MELVKLLRISNTILGQCKHLLLVAYNGTGKKKIDKKPPEADQNGMIQKEETVEISIPAGVEDGMQLKVSGKGNASR